MQNILQKIKAFFKKNSTMTWEEEYLSQSTSLEDLERRQKRLMRGEVANQALYFINKGHC